MHGHGLAIHFVGDYFHKIYYEHHPQFYKAQKHYEHAIIQSIIELYVCVVFLKF